MGAGGYMAIATTISQGVTGGIAEIRNRRTATMQNALYDRQEKLAKNEKDFNNNISDKKFNYAQEDAGFNRALWGKQAKLNRDAISSAKKDMKDVASVGLFNRQQNNKIKNFNDKRNSLLRLR